MVDSDMDMEGGRRSGGGKLIVIILVVVILLVAGGIGVWLFAPGLLPGGGEKTEAQEDGTQVQPSVLYPMKSFVTNLVDPSGKRYIKVTLSLELDNEQLKSEIDARLPQIQDAILTLLSSKSYEDIGTIEGKRRLRSEIISRCNTFLKAGKVTNVFFSEFVVQ